MELLIGMLMGMFLYFIIDLYHFMNFKSKTPQVKSSGDYSWLVKEAIVLKEENHRLKKELGCRK